MKRCIQIFNESKELSLGKLAVIHRTSEHEDSGGKPRVENPRICSPMRVQTNNQESKVFNDESGSKQKKKQHVAWGKQTSSSGFRNFDRV